MPEDTLASFGSSKRFECRVIGYPTPRITWLKDDMNITKSDRYKFDYSVDGYVTMEIENVTYADVGSYQCLAVNSEGWASTTALLKVKGTDTDKTDDTMTVHRMTFDQSGSRKDSNKRPLVLVNLDKTESLDDFLSMDQINRSLSPNGIRQISMKALSTVSATVEDGKRNMSFLGSEPNEIDISNDNITPNHSMFETGLPSKCLDEKVIDDSGKALDVDLAETDSGNFSSSSSIKQQNENKGGKITISIDEVSDDEDLHAGLEDTVEELASFLKADDEFNRSRRLTGDSGIADDDYSPLSSDEDVGHMGDKKRASRKHSDQHNKKRAKKSPSCDDLVDDQFIKSENHINNEKLELTTNISNDKVSPSGINVDPFDNKTSSSTSKMEDQNSVSEVDKPSYNIDNNGYPDVDGKSETYDKPICENESEVENFVQKSKTTVKNDRLKDGITSHQSKQKPNAIEEKNAQFDAENINSEDDGEDIFHSDEEEHKILAEIRPNLHLKKQLLDETTINAFSAESWSVYDSGHDCTLSESNFDAFSYQNVDIVDDGKSIRNDIRDSIGKDNMCDTAGKNDITHIDRTDNKTEQNLSCDGKINDEGYKNLDHFLETDCSNTEKTTTVEKAFNEPEDITFVKSAGNKGEDNVDFANDNVSNDGEHVFHSDEEEHHILAEIRPNLHLKKPLLDETRSNTLSLQSAESWSMYESCDDYSLSETNLDALSYQNIDDENVFLCKFEEKSSKIGDLTTDNRIEDIQNRKESGLIQENNIKDEDSRQSHKTTEKESNGRGKISGNMLGFKIESQADTDKIKMDTNQLNCDKGDERLDTETRQDNRTNVSTSISVVKEKLKTDIDTEESTCIENKGNKLLTDSDDDESPLAKDKTSWVFNNSEIDESAYSNDKVPNLVTDNCVEKFLDTDETGGIVTDIDFDITESPTKKTIRGLLADSDKSRNDDGIDGLVTDFDINESSHKDPTIDLNIEESIKDQIGELVNDTDINKSKKDKGIGISTDFDINQSPTKDEIGELVSDIDIDESPNKDKNIGILSDFDIDKSPIKDEIGELVSDIHIDESPNKDKASGILSNIETNTFSIKDKIDCLVADIDVNESPNKDRADELLVDADIDKSLSIKDNRMQILVDNDISESLDTKDKMDALLSEKDIDNNQYQDSDILKQNGPLLDKSKDNKTEQFFALGDDQTYIEQSNKIIQDYNEKFRSLGEHENDRSSKHEKNENDESDLLTVDLRDTPYSSDEYIDDESDVSVEEIEEERCDILKQLDLSTYIINDASRQLPVLEENTSTELSDDNDCKNVVSDTLINNTIKDDEIFSLSSTGNSKADENIEKLNIHKIMNDNKVNKSINKNNMNYNQKSNDEMNMNDTSVNEKLDIACDNKEFEKRHGIKTLQQLHSIPAYDEVNDESIGLESLSDTRPALPNTLFIGDNQSLASLMGRIAAETNTQQNASPPELEDIDFNDFVNILAVVPGKDARILLSPISEEGTVSQIAESVDSLSPESVEEHTVKKPKRPSLIDLTVTDTDGVVERINLQNIDVLQSFSKLRNYDQTIETGTEQIPRIVKGPSSTTAIDGEEIILQWTITGFPEPEVVIFKDGETLDICDGITLENDKNTWTLQIPYGMKEDAGLYEICAVNSSGNDILKTRVYVKNAKNSPVREDEFYSDQREEQTGVPEFLKTPSNVEVIEGDIIHVECQITGDPSPQIVWFKNGELFYPEERVEILQDSTKCQLIIQHTEPEDAGIYMCRASNSVGVNQVQFTVCVNDQGDKIQTATDINNDEDRAMWDLVSGHDKVDKPTAPVIQLDMSESDECFSRRYEVLSDYHDEFNDVDLQKGEIIEVLDRSKESHWLVKSMKEQTKVCYAPPYLLVVTDVENVGNIPGWNQGQAKNSVSKEEIQTKTKKVLTDLLESETDYICDLKDLIDTYSQSLEKGKVSDRKNIKEGKISNKKPVADKQDKIFDDLSKLYQFHKETLLPSLLKTQDDAESVGDLFTEKRGSFCEYVPFVSDHDKAMEDTDPDQLAALMEAFSLILGDPANAFEDLMNRPLERIHEYIELLKTLIKLTAQSGGDCSGLMAAVQMLTEICRTMEDIILLDKIEGYQGDVKQLGPVLKHEDVVKVMEDKESESEGHRHVILFPDQIMVTKPMTSDPKGKLEFEKIIELKDLSVGKQEQTDGSSCTIELWEDKSSELSASPSLKLQVQDIHAKQAWLRDIREAKKKLELQEETLTMPEFKQKLKGKNLTSTPKKSKLVKNIDSVDVESDRSSDDFNILGTTRKDLVGDRYVAAEFEDGTTRPVFKRKLQKTIVEENSTAKLECEVAGIPLPKVLWLKNNRPLFESDHCKVISDGATHILEFTDIRKGDTGLYTARAMNVNGSTISTTELYVGEVQPALLNKYKEGLSDSKYQTPAYFFQMNSCQVEEGRLARFDCRVVAYPKPEIVWMKDGKVVEPNDRYKLLNFNNEIYSLLIQNVVKEDMGRYTCWAHNKYGEAMTEAYLNVIAFHDQQEEGDISPQFLTRFYDQTLTEGVPAELQCLIDGRPFPTIKWLFNDIEIIPNDNVHILQEKNLIGLCIKEVTPNDLGTYTCNLKNALGEASCSAGLNVLSEKIKNVPVLPKFLRKLSDQNVRTGEGVTFEVVVIGEPPPKVTWLFNHKPISETRRRFKISQDGDVYRLTIEDLILDDDGKITCKAVNTEGEVYSSGNLLVRESRRASEKPDEPKFTQKDFDAKYGYLPTFIKKIEDTSIPAGKDGKFECRVMGIPEPTVTWKKDGRNLTNDGHYLISQDGGNCYLTIRGAKDRDQGLYTCIVANAAGENTCTAYMKLTEALKAGENFERESSLTPLIRRGTGEVPTMPYEKPTISDIRPESTRLTWQPVLTSALSPDSKNIKYLIEGRELPDADWRKLASGIHGNTHLLRNLRPQRDYDFRVRAENQFGVSDATTPAMLERPRPEVDDFVDSMKSKVPQFKRPPELPKSKPLIADFGTDSVKLAWQPAYVPPAVKTAPPVSYRLEAQELPATDWLPLSSRLTDTSHYLSDLLSDRDYNIRVRAENKYGLSEPTESIWIPRAKAFPGVPISRPEIIEMEPHMVKLRWERVDVPSFSANDKDLMYMIEMQAPPVREWSTVARDIPGTVYVVSDLEPGQDYKFRVRARTPLGKMSEPSPVTSVYRTVATSVAPIDSFELEDQDVDFDGIRLRWNRVEIPPYDADEQPLLYMIEMNEPPLDEWRPIVSGLPTTKYRVTDLIPDRDYHFRVRALSSYGVSPPSYTLPVSYRRPLPGPSRVLSEYPQIVYDESDALQLAWQPPRISTTEPIRYRVELQAPPSLAWKPLATGIPDTRYPIRGLGPSRDYMFRVVPETRAGTLEPLPPVSLTSLPAPRTFLPSQPEILDYKPDSFMLSWRRPYVDTHLPIMYRIEMQEPPSVDWRPLVSDVADTRYHVTGLQPSRDYSFRIVPYSGSDYWEPLPPVTITSMPVKPRFRPHEPTITPFGDNSIKLSWKPADIPMYPRTPVPIRYIVDMRTLPSYDWTPLMRNILDTSYIVKGLSPLKEYQFRVRPQTDYGIGEPTMPATFYRKPVPMLRHEPIISNIYGDSVLLSWQPAEVQGDFKFPPKVTYSIEMQDRPGVGPWTPFLTGINGTNYQVTGLRPDREYFFRVRGHVGDVFGEPSAPVYLTHRAGPPKMPNEQPYISEMSPNSVHLQWRAVQLPSKITDYAPVTYRLEVQELPRSDWVILVDGIPHTDFHVTNLHPDKEYNFRVRAINKYGFSEPTPLVQIRRRAVPPRMPKDEPMIYDIGHGSLMLSWRPADVPHYLSDSPVTYTIYVQEPHSTTWRPLYRRIPYTSYHVTNLHSDRDYCFRVQAENIYGVSQPTNTVRLTRLSDFRSPVDIPEISEFDDTRSSLMLRWKPKQIAPFAGKPLKYHIESWEPVKRTWRSLARDIPDTSYRLTGLSPENDYILRVRAQAESALSEPSYPISTSRYRTRAPITRPQLYDVESDSVRLSWQPYAGTITPRRYRLELRESSVPDWRPVTTDIYGTTHKVTGLKPKQDYEFRVRGITEKGPTDYVYSVPLHRRSVIPRMPLAGVDVVNVDDDYVDLSWRMVDIPAYSADDKPLAFLIEAQQLPRYDWLPVASGISDTSYRVKNLQRNQDYVFRIRGEYPSGLSQPSQHVPVYRRPIRPGVPITRPEIIDEDSTSARLRWQRVYTPPYRHSDPISYQIEQQEAPYRNWRPLARGITMTEHTITDLMPKKDYLFRIRAESQNGDISAPTPPISYYKSPTPSPRTPRKTVDYKLFEQDYSVPSRCYVDHLTTFIPPRLPLDKPDLTENGSSTVSLRWKPAQVPERTREKYPITYSIEVKNPPNFEWRDVEAGLTGLSHTLKDIHPEIDYMFRIRAHNEFGSSEATLPVSLYRPIEVEQFYDDEYDSDYEVPFVTLGDCVPPKLPMETPRLTSVTGERAMLHWLSARIPAYAKKVPITYIVEIKEDNMSGFSHFQSGIIDTKFLLEGLNPNMSYQFRVKAETQFGCSDPTLAVSLDRNKDKVKKPLIDLKREDLEIPQAKIRDAAPKGVPPRMSSSRPLITNHYGGNLLLTWGPARVPSYVKGSSLKYMVEKREPPHSTWTVLADNLVDNEYDVTGLNPERDYMFRIRAKNQFGASDPTMPCSVINVRDDYVPPVFSRSQSRDSGTPRMSRRSSIESPLVLSRQISLDESDDMYRSGMPPEFKSTVEELQYGVLGKTARINLAVRGFPLPVIEWTFKGNNLSDKNKYKSIITPSGVITLDIFNLCLDDIGEYKCTAENDNGIKIIIVQLEYADAPTFIEPTEDMYLDSHKSGRFECKVDGIPYPKIRWMKDTRPITETSRLKIQHTKPNQWSLSLNDVISLDSGLYTCVAENVAGKSISSSNLFVDELETTTKQISFREAVFEDYYYPLEELGRGRHGIVRRVIQKSTGKEYAAKLIPACNEELKFFFGHELNNLRRINNQRVPSVIDAFQSERQLVIVMELVKGKSLADHILSKDKWTESEAVKYVKQLLEILRNIHASSIAHLDIKPSNIFLSSPDSDQIRLIDFGLSRHMSVDYDVKLNYGTEEFTSPEQIKNETVSSASDMWSVGILTYILLSGVSPLRGDNYSETLKKVMEGKINPSEENFKHVSEDAIDFLAELLVVDPCDRLTAAECLQHSWIKESADKGNSPLDLGPLVSFQARDLAQRKASSLRSIPQLHCLTSVLEQTVPVTPFTTAKDNESGNQTYPDCEYFGEYLDEESWYDWQNRYHRGPGAKVVPLTEAEYLARIPGLRTTRRMTDVDDEDVEATVRRKTSVMEADRDIHEDPCLRKELQYGVVADDVKQRKKASKDLFPKDDTKDENPQIVSKFHDLAFTPGENIVLRCTLDIDEPPAVTWYRNEELVSESSRIYIKVTDNGTLLTVVSAKPYDSGIYKCVVRSKGGKATAAARVLVGDVPSQPSRPVATQVSSTQVLLLWEPPTTNGNSYITGYRVDCRKTNGNSWLTVAHPIDECTIVKDLAPNTSYRFRACAVNQFGFSAYSVASPEIVTAEDGDKIVLDEYTSAILARQSGVHLMPSPPISGPVQLTEGSFSEKYKLTETVYSGKFSEIKIAENISTKRSHAAKIIPCDKDKISTEFEILKLMNHEKVIRLYDGFLFSEKLYIITEYLCGVNVLQHFAFKSKYSEDMVAIVLRQILEGVQYLHHVGVVHLNLQPSSMVMRSRRHLDVKICGFSHARKVSGNGEVVPCEGYPDFIAPEIVTRKTTTYSADIWTVGVLSFLLLSGDSPFRASSVEETYFNIVYSRYDAHSLYDNITRDALRFMNRIMKRIPSNRMSVEDCLEDKWLQVADTTVKTRQEAVFTTAKLRLFADLYRERGILGIWMPEELPETEKEIDEITVKKEKKTEVPTKTETEQTSEAKENIKTETQKDDSQVISQANNSPAMSEKIDGIVESQQNVIDKVAETVVTEALEDAFKSKEFN